VLVVSVGIVARFLAPNGLWLDEALSVNIAKLPLAQLPGALVQDGSPPLYYVLLHYWMLAFGQGEHAVRALSGLVSVATLPLLWLAGRRAGGRRAAWAALLLGASSPWAIYYGSYARMYSLMALESALLYLAIANAMELPTRRRLVAVGAVTAALVYTHYWDLYLVGVVGLWALWRARQESLRGGPRPGHSPGAARSVFKAMFLGGLSFLPWSPVFVFQVLHTGTPWSAPPGPSSLLSVFAYFAGEGPWAVLLGFAFFAFLALAFFGRPGVTSSAVVLELRPRQRASVLGFFLIGTLVVAVAVGAVTGAAFDQRYIAVVFPLFIVLCALGVTTFASRTVTAGALCVACVAGLLSAQYWDSQPRTQAVQVAAVLGSEARPGDMVVYCPDQLGPAVSRLVDVPGLTQVTFPRMIGPQRVDWVNYLATIKGTNVEAFAREVVARLNSGSTLWLVWRNGYQGFGASCGDLESWLAWYLPGGSTTVTAQSTYYESENLVAFPS